MNKTTLIAAAFSSTLAAQTADAATLGSFTLDFENQTPFSFVGDFQEGDFTVSGNTTGTPLAIFPDSQGDNSVIAAGSGSPGVSFSLTNPGNHAFDLNSIALEFFTGGDKTFEITGTKHDGSTLMETFSASSVIANQMINYNLSGNFTDLTSVLFGRTQGFLRLDDVEGSIHTIETAAPVPLPASGLMFATAVIGGGIYLRRRKGSKPVGSSPAPSSATPA